MVKIKISISQLKTLVDKIEDNMSFRQYYGTTFHFNTDDACWCLLFKDESHKNKFILTHL